MLENTPFKGLGTFVAAITRAVTAGATAAAGAVAVAATGAGAAAAATALLLANIAAGQAPAAAPTEPLAVRSIAEVETRSVVAGREVVKLVPADRVVPGDRVIYTLEARNTAAAALEAPIITFPVPEYMRYVANSAVGPGAEVSYSVDGGHHFDSAENLTLLGAAGRPRRAAAADYTHIRWQLKHSLKPNSVAFVRFRAVVK
jgi:uncharacterized repeat protein (TIGR01451 family)